SRAWRPRRPRPRHRYPPARPARKYADPVTVTLDQIRAVPKVLLHDHLDGGLRPATIIELARAIGYADLPSYEPDALGRAMVGSAHHGHLELYLEALRPTGAVVPA